MPDQWACDEITVAIKFQPQERPTVGRTTRASTCQPERLKLLDPLFFPAATPKPRLATPGFSKTVPGSEQLHLQKLRGVYSKPAAPVWALRCKLASCVEQCRSFDMLSPCQVRHRIDGSTGLQQQSRHLSMAIIARTWDVLSGLLLRRPHKAKQV